MSESKRFTVNGVTLSVAKKIAKEKFGTSYISTQRNHHSKDFVIYIRDIYKDKPETIHVDIERAIEDFKKYWLFQVIVTDQ